MRQVQYLSPTAISKFQEDPETYYLEYLADVKAPRLPQTMPMSIGSSFDAHVKSHLHEALFGKNHDPKFELTTLFEAQVEPQNRSWARDHGQHAFELYKRSGALSDLLIDLQHATNEPRFELDIKGTVGGRRDNGEYQHFEGLILNGKPDVFYINRHGCHVILDWKVNGWCSRSNVSPMKGYVRLRQTTGTLVTTQHKDCMLLPHKGSLINHGMCLEDGDKSWAAQLSIYSWLCGCEIGSDFIAAIDQFACKPSGEKYPTVRIAEHRLLVSKQFQWSIIDIAKDLWDRIQTGHFFKDLTLEESQQRCASLEARAKSLATPETVEDAIFNSMTRG